MKLLTPEETRKIEMNAQTKFMVDKYQEFVKVFDVFSEDMKAMKAFGNEVKSTFGVHDSDIKSLAKGLTSGLKALGDAIQSVERKIEGLNLNHEDLKTKHQNHTNQTQQIRVDLQNHIGKTSNSFVDIESKFAKNEKTALMHRDLIQAVMIDLNNLQAKIKEKVEEIEKSMADLLEKHNKNNLLISVFGSDVINVKKTLESHSGMISNIAADMGLSRQYIDGEINNLSASLKSHVKDAIAAIPKPEIPSLEDSKLDSKNANLRSQNNETKIYLLEKKVEQLQLLLNKLQLSG